MKKKAIFFITMFVLLNSVSFVFADDINEDPIDEVFEVLKKYYLDTDDLENTMMKYDSSNYYLDIKKYSAIFDPIKKLTSNVNSINNLIFGINKMISKITIFILLFTYKVDMFQLFGGYIDLIIDALRVPIFDKTLLTVIAFIGLYSIIVAVVGDRKTTIMNNTIKTLIIVTIAVIFLLNPSKYLTKMNDISIQVSDEIFRATYARYQKIPDSEEALFSAGNMLWDIMVHKPWQSLTIGKFDENISDKILKDSPYDKEREDLINELSEDNSLLRLEGIPTRFGTLILFTIFNTILGIIIIGISSISIIAQILVIIFSFAAPVIFLISLFPRFSNTLGRWGLKIIGYSFIKIVLSMFLSVVLVINAAIFSNITKNGLIITSTLMIIATTTVYLSRHKIASIIQAIPKGERAVRREIKTPSGAVERIKDVKNIVSGYAKEKTKSTVNTGKNLTVNSARKVKDFVSNPNRYNRAQQERYKQMAETYLNRKYQEEKTNAELKAQRLGRDEVIYSDFVKDANVREKLGEKKFTESQINHVIKIIRKIEMAGEDPNKFIEGNNKELLLDAKQVDKKIEIYDDNKFTDKELFNKMGEYENKIQKIRKEVETKTDMSGEEKDKALFEMYKLWQKKFEMQNIVKNRRLKGTQGKYSKFNEYKELEEIRIKANEEIKEMAKIFSDDFNGDKLEAFSEKLDIQIELKNKEDVLLNTLDKKRELADIRSKAFEQEKKIINEFGLDKIKNKDMLVYEQEKYEQELEKLKGLYKAEDTKVKELKKEGINVEDINLKAKSVNKDRKGDEAENILLARAELGIFEENPYKDFSLKDVAKGKNINIQSNQLSENSVVKESRTIQDSRDITQREVEKIRERPVKIEQKLDIEKLAQRDEEILQEITKQNSSSEVKSKQTIQFETENIEKLGEEISKNIENNGSMKGSVINTVQNIQQDIVVNTAKEFDKQFNQEYGLKNNQIFFENIIRKYGIENVKNELEGMKEQEHIKNPKGLLITRLKNNYKEE